MVITVMVMMMKMRIIKMMVILIQGCINIKVLEHSFIRAANVSQSFHHINNGDLYCSVETTIKIMYHIPHVQRNLHKMVHLRKYKRF